MPRRGCSAAGGIVRSQAAQSRRPRGAAADQSRRADRHFAGGHSHLLEGGAGSGGGLSPRRQQLRAQARSEEHTSELQSLMRISYAVFCLKKKKFTPIFVFGY